MYRLGRWPYQSGARWNCYHELRASKAHKVMPRAEPRMGPHFQLPQNTAFTNPELGTTSSSV
jgi:hypothetical protein